VSRAAVLASAVLAWSPAQAQGPDVRLRLAEAPGQGRLQFEVLHTGVPPDDLDVSVVGGTLRHAHLTPLPRASRTDLVLHAPDERVRAVREVARGWVDVAGRTETLTLTGQDEPLRGARALDRALAEHLLDPLPSAELAELIARPLPEQTRRVIISTSQQDLEPSTEPPTGLTHVLLLGRPGFQAPADRPRLRRALAQVGGSVLVATGVDEGRALMTGLPAREPVRSRLSVRACRDRETDTTAELVVRARDTPLDARLPLPASAVPTCPDASAQAPSRAATPTADDSLPWPTIGGVVAGLTVIGAGTVWLLRNRRPRSPAPDAPRSPAAPSAPRSEADAPGRILATVDPDAPIRLTVVRGTGLVGSEIPVPTGTLTVGAAPGNDALIDLAGISGKHARFECFPTGDVFVRDADSANGTWVHGRRLERSERIRLRSGDRVTLGPSLELELAVITEQDTPSGQGSPPAPDDRGGTA